MLCKITKRLSRDYLRLLSSSRNFSTQVQTSTSDSSVAPHSRLQFSKERLVDFGELPRGEIPDALRYDRPSNMTKLENGVRVASESYQHTGLVTLGFYWTFGSRHETTSTSSLCNFLSRLSLKGTSSKTREQIDSELAGMGASVTTCAGRERTGWNVTVTKSNVQQAVDLFSDLLTNSTFDANMVEAEREGVTRSILELERDQMDTTMENLYYTSYRESSIGQPQRGVRENVNNITSDLLQGWASAHCVGRNLVVVASGDCTHEEVVATMTQGFGKFATSSGQELANLNKPVFTPSIMFIRDDEMANVNTGVFFNAPPVTHEDSYAMTLFQEILGEYREDRYTGSNLNAADRQYNSFHGILGNMPDLSLHKAMYMGGSDWGLFGSYMHGNEVHSPQLCWMSQSITSEFAYHLNQAEVFRARAKYWNDLLNDQSGSQTNEKLAEQVIAFGRVVPRSEKATRISNAAEDEHLQRVATEWFWDRDISATAWGNLHGVASASNYNRAWRRSTLGWYGNGYWSVS